MGIKWFGTASGVSKFDGTNWTVYNDSITSGGLAGNYVRAIKFDAQGNKWFATSKGLCKFNDTTWTVYNPTNTSYGLLHEFIDDIAFDAQGNKWICTDNGLTLMKEQSPTTGIKTVNNADDLVVFPNPIEDYLNLKSNNNLQGAFLSIIDIYGKTVYTQKLNSNQLIITTENLASGIYFIKVESLNGLVVTRRFVKE